VAVQAQVQRVPVPFVGGSGAPAFIPLQVTGINTGPYVNLSNDGPVSVAIGYGTGYTYDTGRWYLAPGSGWQRFPISAVLTFQYSPGQFQSMNGSLRAVAGGPGGAVTMQVR
jgi:hypothetical protein